MIDVQYRSIPGLPDFYRVGDDGSIWTCARGAWRLIAQTPQHDGYFKVRLTVTPATKSRVSWRIHRVVLSSFVGPRPDGMEARHINSNKADNRLCNLEWATPERNFEDRVKRGTVVTRQTSSWRRLDERHIASAIQQFKSGAMIKDIAANIGVDPSHVSKILRGEQWSGTGETPLLGFDARSRGAAIREQRKREAARCIK